MRPPGTTSPNIMSQGVTTEQPLVGRLRTRLAVLAGRHAKLLAQRQESKNHRHLIQELRTQNFVRIRLPECDRGAIQSLREFSSSFFCMDLKQKKALGDFRRIGGHLVGYQNQDNREFAEIRMDSEGMPSPWLTEAENTESRSKFQLCCQQVHQISATAA